MRNSLRALSPALWLALLATCTQAAPNFVWLEAEQPTLANFKIEPTAGPPDAISGGQWVQQSLNKDQFDQLGEGRELSYDFQTPSAGDYQVWIHLGLEFVRAPLQWHLDDGPPQTVAPDDLGLNLIELGEWYEASWVHAGQANLAAGPHRLTLKASEPNGDRFLLALDAICLVQGEWQPDGALQPGQTPNAADDQAAAARVTTLAAPTGAQRAVTTLDGLWQVARWDDPDMDQDPYEPETALPPGDLVWRGVKTPGDLFAQPLFNFAHRVVYRTQVQAPADIAQRAAFLDSDGAGWIMTVFVNGQRVGWRRTTRLPWRLDLAGALKPGLNELAIAVKSPWYGLSPGQGQDKDRLRNLPTGFWKHARQVASFYPSTKGDSDGLTVGLTDSLRLVVCGGPAYIDDVFAQPKVVGGLALKTDVTARNGGQQPVSAELRTSVIDDATGAVVFTYPNQVLQLAAAGEGTASLAVGGLNNIKLWWPGDDPAAMYRVRCELYQGDQPIDSFEQPFGFRDVTIDGKFFRLNGVRRNFWNLLGSLKGSTDAEKVANFKATNNRFERFGRDLAADLDPELALRSRQLDWMDRHGIPGRLSSMIDGMFITHQLNDPDLWRFFAEHIEQMVRQNRNHPSVIVYSLENELMFITAALAYRDQVPRIEEEVKKNLFEVSHRWDPTRPAMLDGGGALIDNSAEICCTHYLEDGFRPDNAQPLTAMKSQGFWSWDEQRPYSAGEVAYFQGDNADHAWIGGERAASGRAEARESYALYIRSMLERYRWNDVAMTCPWMSMENTGDLKLAMSDLAAFTRYYNTSFFGGQPVQREVKVFNDTLKADPLTFTWSFMLDGQRVAGDSQELNLEPGFAQVVNLNFTPPPVKQRTAGTLWLKVNQPGATEFLDHKAYAIYPASPAGLKLTRQVFALPAPDTDLVGALAGMGVPAKTISTPAEASAGGIIVVAPQLPNLKAITPDLVTYARAGGRVVCLEQAEPWQADDLPVALKLAQGDEKKPATANFTFNQGPGLRLFEQLGERDLCCWAGDEPTAIALWERPSGGARSWVAAGQGLRQSALIEVPLGPGQMMATQLRVGAKLAIEPAARQLLGNLLATADAYEPPSKALTLCAGEPWATFVKQTGVRLQTVADPLAALDATAHPIALVEATAANLAALVGAQDRVKAYWQSGGWLVLCGLAPDGLGPYNQLLGTEHVLREFRTERVRLERDLLTVGLDSPDVTLYGEQVIAPWAGLRIASRELFSTVVDAGPNIAPFCFGPVQSNREFTPGNGPLQLVNGLFNADFWWYIDQIGYETIPPEKVLHTFALPAPTPLESAVLWNNANYDTAADCELRADGQVVAKTVLPDSYDSVEVPLNGVTASNLAIVATSVRRKQDKPLVGLDEVRLLRSTPAWAANGQVVPLVDVGGLVKYPRARGGALLCNLLPTDSVAESVPKKQRLLAALLANLGAASEG